MNFFRKKTTLIILAALVTFAIFHSCSLGMFPDDSSEFSRIDELALSTLESDHSISIVDLQTEVLSFINSTNNNRSASVQNNSIVDIEASFYETDTAFITRSTLYRSIAGGTYTQSLLISRFI